MNKKANRNFNIVYFKCSARQAAAAGEERAKEAVEVIPVLHREETFTQKIPLRPDLVDVELGSFN